MNTKISFGSIMKVVNIIFLIVLENFVLDCGMGIWSVSLLVYFLLYTLLFSGLQNGITKMVGIRNSKGINGNSRRIVKPVSGYVILVGLLILTAAFLLPDAAFIKILGTSYPVPVIQLLCIVLILNGITDVLCGYHNGSGNATISNMVYLIKTILPIALSFFVIRIFTNYGSKVAGLLKNTIVKDAYTAIGITCVYVLTAIIAFLVVIVLTIITGMHSKEEKMVRGIDSRRNVAGGFFSVTIRLTLRNLFPVLSVFTAIILYLNSAAKTGISTVDIYTNIGALFTKLFLPSILILILFSEYIARERHRLGIDYRKDEIRIMTVRTQYMIKNSFFMLLPPTIILTFLAESITKVIYAGKDTLSPQYLQTGGFILLLSGVAYALNNILTALEKETIAWLVQGGCLAAQIIFLIIGLSRSGGNSMMILYSFYFYFGLQICIFAALSFKVVRFDLLDILMKLGKYGVAGIIMMVLFMILEKFIVMNVFLMILSIFLGYLLYYLTLIALHGISKKDEAALKRTLNYYPVHFLRSRLRL